MSRPVLPRSLPSRSRAQGCGCGNVRTGLFETASDVDICIGRVGAQIASLDRDMQNYAIGKYGPNQYAASVSAAQLEQFRADKSFYQSWRGFTDAWETYVNSWNNRIVSVLSADSYRQCVQFDGEQKGWQDKWIARGGTVTAPRTTTPSAIPGIIPDSNGGSGLKIPWVGLAIGAAVVVGGYMYLNRHQSSSVSLKLPPAPPPVPGAARHAAEHGS